MPLAEYTWIEKIVSRNPSVIHHHLLGEAKHRNVHYPVPLIELGNPNPDAPCFTLVAGVHGKERIGCEVVLSFLSMLAEQSRWNPSIFWLLERIHLVFIPLVNPVGIACRTRSNGHHVDLMRNAPIEAEHPPPWLVGGHRISPQLPWYRGPVEGPMELENQWLETAFETFCLPHTTLLSLDCHSGFGATDRIWFPFACQHNPFPHYLEMAALENLYHLSCPNHHHYHIEPQSRAYLAHGDFWDYLFLKHYRKNPSRWFFPLTLEMGSWLWLRKNPFQLFSSIGIFHPIKQHRTRRVLRQHQPLFLFLIQALLASNEWLPAPMEQRPQLEEQARHRWYPSQ